MAEERATFGGGCFWCVEAIYQDLSGVLEVVSGYAGGSVPNPTYQEVCHETTGHAEVVQIRFEPETVSYRDMLDVFWRTHDRTTLNRQGADVGTQYRSVIFYHNEQQRAEATQSLAETDASALWADPIVTEITPLTEFYRAEDYHQNYYRSNRAQPYCIFVIDPKMQGFREAFQGRLKTG
ncbi:MAG: peptide-methionine (S)-S-oxide reductase MsrA [Candidatus Latescibacteria bacterium]|nr:peptide-methionine (S)-S-oxide reductase MsrA [Candidatus Latescibacterota bacterium]